MARRSEDEREGDAAKAEFGAGDTRIRQPDPVSGAADRPVANPAFYSSAGSIRRHSKAASWGLAAKIAVPAVAAALVSFVIFFYIVQGKVFELQFNDIKGRAYPVARAIAKYGRILLTWKERSRLEHPEYETAPDWKVRDHWLVAGGFIEAGKFADLVGALPDDVVPVDELERAAGRAQLLRMSEWLLDDDDLDDSELVAAYILDLNGNPVASSRDLTPGAFGASSDWWLAADGLVPAAVADAGRSDMHPDFIIDKTREPLLRVTTPIAGGGRRAAVGTAVVVFRTDGIQAERREFLYTTVALAAVLLAFMSAACWFAARRVTQPMRRLAADMHAIADGDYGRRSAIVGADEIGLLAQAFNSMAERLRVARLNERETNRLESDLAVARSIQNNLLPPQTPLIRGLDIGSSYHPAREIGGDYYDFLLVDSQHMGIIVADASGKSIPAALVMSTTRAILRFVAPGSLSAAETLTRANAILSVDIPRAMFVTAYYLILDPLNGSMVCASAGHNPLLIARADDAVELVNPGGIAIGFDQGPIFQRSIREQRVQLAKGDRVLVYTDGVVECSNPANEEYSDRRLQEFLRRHRDLASHDFVGALLADLDRHRGAADIHDDTTIVTFKVV